MNQRVTVGCLEKVIFMYMSDAIYWYLSFPCLVLALVFCCSDVEDMVLSIPNRCVHLFDNIDVQCGLQKEAYVHDVYS